jgi:trehalose transport system substrate-binding protein
MARRWRSLVWLGCWLGWAAVSAAGQPELAVMMGLGEAEWRVMRSRIFPPFEQRHGVTIRGIQAEAADAVKKLRAMQRAGRMAVDLIAQDVLWLRPLVEADLMEDLSAHRQAIPATALPQLVEVGTVAGRLYFLPYRPNVQIAYYHADKFAAYGLQPPQTWEELLAVARRFREAEGIGRVLLHGTLDQNTTTQVIEFIWAAGGDPLALDDAGAVQAFAFLQQLAPYLAPETRRANWNTANIFLATEAAYLARNWPFGVQLLVQEVGKTEIKAYHGWRGPVREAHVLGGEVLGIPKGAPQRELALEFMRYLMSKPVQEMLVASLGWPSFRSDAYGQVQAWQAPYFAAVQEALAHARPRPQAAHWAQVDRALTGAFRDIVYEGQPVQATLERYRRQVQEARPRGR